MPLTRRRRVILAAAASLVVATGIGAATTSPLAQLPTPDGASGGTPLVTHGEPTDTRSASRAHARLADLEQRRDGRVGLVAIDTASGETLTHRADERFALASTGKLLLAAVVLDRLPEPGLERRLRWTEADLVAHSPATELVVDDGMTVRQLIDASLTLSDNTATNVLFELVGGPGEVEAWLRERGDDVTSVDRVEPELNDWRPGDSRDTSTPRALAQVTRALLTGDLLDHADRTLLADELGDSITGARLVRAGVPDSWRVGDKSGTAAHGTRNDVAIVHPPGRDPWIVVVMSSHDDRDAEPGDVLVQRATEILVSHWS